MFCLEGIPGGGFLKQKAGGITSQIYRTRKGLTLIARHQNQTLQMPARRNEMMTISIQ